MLEFILISKIFSSSSYWSQTLSFCWDYIRVCIPPPNINISREVRLVRLKHERYQDKVTTKVALDSKLRKLLFVCVYICWCRKSFMYMGKILQSLKSILLLFISYNEIRWSFFAIIFFYFIAIIMCIYDNVSLHAWCRWRLQVTINTINAGIVEIAK